MKPRTSAITATDLFCGAGGSSLGATASGIEVRVAANHWQLAIETHNTNFPATLHMHTDISRDKPSRFPTTDILIASPECTNHSLAKGVKRNNSGYDSDLFGNRISDPDEERSRATMWDVVRFAEYHQYNAIIVENVVDARRWQLFNAWLTAMHDLGYRHQCVYLNSMFAHPTPQSRDRMYVVFTRVGNPAPDLDIMPRAHCPHCGKDVDSRQTWKNGKTWGKYGVRNQYVYTCPTCAKTVTPYYYAAASALDWSLPAERISDRKKPLKARTMDRIAYGLKKFAAKDSFIMSYYGNDQASLLSAPLPTQSSREHSALVMPFIVSNYGGRPGVSPVDQPMVTQSTMALHRLCIPPFIINTQVSTNRATAITDPLMTQTTQLQPSLIVPPFIFSLTDRVMRANDVTEPLMTQTTSLLPVLINPSEGEISPEDCLFRMLQPSEIGAAMAFPTTYKVMGNSRQRIKQYGNAVTPPAMELLTQRVVQSLQ